MISIVGTSLKKLRDDAREASLSPDGSQIAFVNVGNTEIWVMAADGSQARSVLKAESDSHLYSPSWFANGKRLFYSNERVSNGSHDLNIESRDLLGGNPVLLLDEPKITDGTFDQPGRLIYARSEPPPNPYDSNLWELSYDQETGKPQGSPRQLTQWTGFSFSSTSLTKDGTHFVFLNDRLQSAAYIGELANGGDELKTPERLTLNENLNWPGGWAPDGKTVLFYSNRDGSFSIYKQGITERTAHPIATGAEDKWAPQISPDGNWVIYLQWSKAPDGTLSAGKLMRAPFAGGAPDSVSDIEGHPALSEYAGSTAGGFPSFRCPRTSGDCVVAERHDEQIVFSSFDPMKGRKAELLKVPFNHVRTAWDLSPDGKRLAISEFSYVKGEISLLPLDGSTPQKISQTKWTELLSVAWAADGKSLFLASFSSRGSAIVHLDFAGNGKQLFKPNWRIATLEP
ncbi:MAG: LpqB family beta-propeller domain-containing protein, partial [Candidatus Sulfotelmatobacter sp.]